MKAVCPGSFDPITHGHLDVIRRASTLFDEVIVAWAATRPRSTCSTPTSGSNWPGRRSASLPGVRVETLSGLLVDFCRDQGAEVVVKGLRFASDFDFELQMAHINHSLTGLETVLLPASAQWGTLSSTMVREVATLGGDVTAFVPPLVAERIEQKRRNTDG